MGTSSQAHGPGPFTLTKGKLFILISLAFTWWCAHLLPHYQPTIKSVVTSQLQKARQKIPSISVDWHRDEDPRANFNGAKVALLVESRYVPHLVPLILHMTYVVPPDWRFVFIGSEKSTAAVGRSLAIKHQQVIGKLDLMTLPPPWDIGSKEMVHRLMTDIRFYEEFLPGVEWILKYESDSIMCANSETSLNDWLDWSWAGAPKTPDDRFAGNGGLSLRRVSAIRKVLSFQQRFNNSQPEDEWFGQRLWVLPGEKVASGLHGALAVEDVYMENAMGYHAKDGGNGLHDDVWKNKAQREKIFRYCPELTLIIDMKLERERCAGDRGDGTIDDQASKKKQQEEEQKKKEEEERKKKEEEQKKKEEEAAKKAAEEDAKKAEEAAKAKAKEGQNQGNNPGDGNVLQGAEGQETELGSASSNATTVTQETNPTKAATTGEPTPKITEGDSKEEIAPMSPDDGTGGTPGEAASQAGDVKTATGGPEPEVSPSSHEGAQPGTPTQGSQ